MLSLENYRFPLDFSVNRQQPCFSGTCFLSLHPNALRVSLLLQSFALSLTVTVRDRVLFYTFREMRSAGQVSRS